jgi:hypothetical protein
MSAATLRAKMVVGPVTRQIGMDGGAVSESVTLHAVYDSGTGPNAQWAQATPYGELKLTISNPTAIGRLIPGRSFYIDFVPVPEEERPGPF